MKKRVWKIMGTIILVLAVLIGCGYLYLYNHGLSGKVLENDPPKDGQIKVACVGDSITYGHGIQDWTKNNYPVLLQNKLGEGYHVQSFGVSGRAVQDSSDQPYRALKHYQQSLEYDADIVVFMMGTNDSKPENWCGRDSFKLAVLDLLDDYQQDGRNPQIYLCTPSTSLFVEGYTDTVTSHDIQPEIVDVIAEIIAEIAEENGYPLIDIHALTGENPQWLEKDGVHPNNDGAAAIAEAVYQAITNQKEEN